MARLNRVAFTLIELMIVVTIILIITVIAIVPYGLYSNISKVKVSKDIILQTVNEAKNSSAGLINIGDNKNQNIALFFSGGGDKIQMVSFPFDYSGLLDISNGALIREIHLESNINTNKFVDQSNNEFSNLILYFKAPNGNMEVYKNNAQTGTLKNIIIGLKEATSSVLSETIEIK